MNFEILSTPVRFLESNLTAIRLPDWLRQYQAWWEKEGQEISDATDRLGTPWLRMFDLSGVRVDQVLYPPEYWRILKRGYQAGMLWRVPEEKSIFPANLGIYVTSFYDPGLACPYTVSLSTVVPLMKYGDANLQDRFLPRLLQKDKEVWQGATWMTEAMILAIWEGPAHRQMLDGLEVMERKHSHRLLLQSVLAHADPAARQQMNTRIEQHLARRREEKESGADALFTELAVFTANALMEGERDKDVDLRN